MNWKKSFLFFEHITMVVTMVAALATITLYWFESQDRAASRRATTVSTYIACQDLLRFSLTQEQQDIHRLLLSTVELPDVAPFCAEVEFELTQQFSEARSRADERSAEALKRAFENPEEYSRDQPTFFQLDLESEETE